MELFIIRHADAAPLGDHGVAEDAARPLTPRGIEQSQMIAAALSRLGVQLAAIVTSPLVRAKQTAEEIVRSWPSPPPALHMCTHLGPGGKRKKIARMLESLALDTVAVVGHEPDLSRFAAWLIGGKKAKLGLAKAGIAGLHSDDGFGKGSCTLTWLAPPEHLRG